MRRGPATASVLVGVCLSAASCTPSLAGFAKRAARTCRQENAVFAAFSVPKDLAALKDYAGNLATVTSRLAGELSDLGPPEEGPASRFIGALTQASRKAKLLVELLPDGDAATLDAAGSDVGAAYGKVGALAGPARLGTCAAGAQKAGSDAVAGTAAALHADFVAKADAKCKSASSDLDALDQPDEPQSLGDLPDYATFVGRVVGIGDHLLSDLRSLTPPPRDAAAFTDFMGAFQSSFTKASELAQASSRRDLSAVHRLASEVARLASERARKGDAFGFKWCGSQLSHG